MTQRHIYDAEWFKSVLNALRDMVLVKGPDAHLLWANKPFLDYYGMTEQDMFDIVDADHSDPDDTLQYVRDDMTVLQTQTHLDIPSEVVTNADGVAALFHTIKSPFTDPDGKLGTVGISRRIDDTSIESRAFTHQDAKDFVLPLKALTDGFPIPMLMVDVLKRVIATSPLWDETFGEIQITPSSVFDGVYPQLSRFDDLIEKSIATNTPTQDIVHYIPEGHSAKAFSAHVRPWSYPNGQIGGVTLVATDVTEQHRKTKALERANDELSQFSYRASHDLKGPLSTAKELARFIGRDLADGFVEDAAESATRIDKLMAKLETTVQDFLSLARADISHETEVVIDLPALVDEIAAGLAQQISDAGVRIETMFSPETFTSQPTRVQQIVENLVSNAIKYASKDKPDPFVRVTGEPAAAGLTISVEDNGQGIPPDAHVKIFDLFSRFHSDSEGTGLGLPIVKRHVDALNGHIVVQDTGQGTLFRVFVPSQLPEASA